MHAGRAWLVQLVLCGVVVNVVFSVWFDCTTADTQALHVGHRKHGEVTTTQLLMHTRGDQHGRFHTLHATSFAAVASVTHISNTNGKAPYLKLTP